MNSWAGYSIKDKEHLKLEDKWASQNVEILKELNMLKKGIRLLGVGCSRGFFINRCESIGIKTNGLDIDPEVIDGKRVRKCDIESEKFPFKNETFDIVFSAGVIQHLSKPPCNFMIESMRVLKKGGKLILMIRNEKSWINILVSDYDNFRHKSTWTKTSLEQMFRFYKFKIIYVNPKFMGMKIFNLLPRFLRFKIGTNIIIVGEKK